MLRLLPTPLGLPSPLTPNGRRRYTPDPRLVFHALRPDASDADFLKCAISGNSINSSPRSSQATYINRFGQMTLAPVNGMRRTAQGLLIEGAAATNLLLNSLFDGTPLASQSVAVTAQAYTLSFYGTGSVDLSGAHTATLAGTGASTRVTLTFTPSAGTLTLTVTGDVHWTQLEAGTWASSFIPTAGTAAVRAAEAATDGLAGYVWPMTDLLAAALTSAGTLCVTMRAIASWANKTSSIVRTGVTAYRILHHDSTNILVGANGSVTTSVSSLDIWGQTIRLGLRWGAGTYNVGRYGAGEWLWGSEKTHTTFPTSHMALIFTGGSPQSACLSNLRVYNTKLTQAEIEALPW